MKIFARNSKKPVSKSNKKRVRKWRRKRKTLTLASHEETLHIDRLATQVQKYKSYPALLELISISKGILWKLRKIQVEKFQLDISILSLIQKWKIQKSSFLRYLSLYLPTIVRRGLSIKKEKFVLKGFFVHLPAPENHKLFESIPLRNQILRLQLRDDLYMKEISERLLIPYSSLMLESAKRSHDLAQEIIHQ